MKNRKKSLMSRVGILAAVQSLLVSGFLVPTAESAADSTQVLPISAYLNPLAPLFFEWDVRPSGFTTFYERQEVPEGCEFCEPVLIQGIRSGYTGGVYGVDADGNGSRDGSLTAEFEMISEVSPTSEGQFLYTWQLRNLGTGAAVAFLGSGPDFSISHDNPLLGTAGPDRLTGTSDDLSVGQTTVQNFIRTTDNLRVGDHRESLNRPGSYALWSSFKPPSAGSHNRYQTW